MNAPTSDKPQSSDPLPGTGDDPLRLLVVAPRDEMKTRLESAFGPISVVALDIVPDGDTAIRMLTERQYDLVAVDPDVSADGFALLRHVKAEYRWVATLIATANQEPQFLRRAVKSRIDGLLFRPTASHEAIEEALLLARAVHGRRQRQQRRVLAIGAHPDDVEIGCGGTLAKHYAHRDQLNILTLSQGAAGGNVSVRVGESQNAAKLIGARLRWGTLLDTFITDGPETIAVIEAAIREIRPTHVYTHSLEDTHQDHRAVHAASLVAARSVPNVYCYQTPSSTVEFKPHRFVDITHFIDRKIELIGAYKSQVDRMESIQPDVIVSTARYWGRFAGHVMVEPLQVVRERDGDVVADTRKEHA